jgi:peptide/nickel transport system substrate-binding protein
MAQFGWITTLEPPCNLYLSDEIPGPYPASPKGWGGANAAGFTNPHYDQACRLAAGTFAGSPENLQAVADAQALFAEELPAIPLYARMQLAASRPDLCGVFTADPVESMLWNLEMIDYGEGCP